MLHVHSLWMALLRFFQQFLCFQEVVLLGLGTRIMYSRGGNIEHTRTSNSSRMAGTKKIGRIWSKNWQTLFKKIALSLQNFEQDVSFCILAIHTCSSLSPYFQFKTTLMLHTHSLVSLCTFWSLIISFTFRKLLDNMQEVLLHSERNSFSTGLCHRMKNRILVTFSSQVIVLIHPTQLKLLIDLKYPTDLHCFQSWWRIL